MTCKSTHFYESLFKCCAIRRHVLCSKEEKNIMNQPWGMFYLNFSSSTKKVWTIETTWWKSSWENVAFCCRLNHTPPRPLLDIAKTKIVNHLIPTVCSIAYINSYKNMLRFEHKSWRQKQNSCFINNHPNHFKTTI